MGKIGKEFGQGSEVSADFFDATDEPRCLVHETWASAVVAAVEAHDGEDWPALRVRAYRLKRTVRRNSPPGEPYAGAAHGLGETKYDICELVGEEELSSEEVEAVYRENG